MSHSHFMQADHRPGGCFACQHWKGEMVGGGAHTVCRREKGSIAIQATTKTGCVYWEYDGSFKTRREYRYPKR